MSAQKIISVIGGNGFIGSYLVDLLLDKGYFVKVISRNPKASRTFYPSAKLGQINEISCDITNDKKLSNAIKGSFSVINLVGILEPKGRNDFERAHVRGSEKLIDACNQNGIDKFIQISAIGVEKNKTSRYAITKLQAENRVKKLKRSIIIRPSIVCGEEDNFLNFFAKYAKYSPILPLIGGGNTKFQPIHVSDLANIITLCINKDFKRGQIIEVGGPDILTFKEILSYLIAELKIKRVLLNIPFPAAKKIAYILEKLPISLMTRDQVEMLKCDNIVSRNYSHKKYFEYNPNSFYDFAKKQLKIFTKDGGH
ncbi:MAG: complex I NDUFA9 subunit family protein [Rickettsiales bacterium]|nr:complex I NDUFA9 subunit family protein [Rickettsiales bacterium]OUV80987.1 MAG: hypothetical protein CBC91_02710 [Rickettsiales bacterium TMED131]|tara:strand:- start:1410 stop:2342 length:933 start_codon:yes stop_codon:yes gene_type:complete